VTERALREAHAANDLPTLARLYADVADAAEADGEIDSACFFLTHAWVFALQAGLAEAERLRERLAAHGRA